MTMIPARDRLPAEVRRLLAQVFGGPGDDITQVAARAQSLLGHLRPIVWEGDAETFNFTFVSPSAEAVLGHAARLWMQPGFWADTVVHDADRRDAVAYCALATGKGKDHEFEYRARTSSGDVRWLFDVVKVVMGQRGVPVRLRGVMIDITDSKKEAGEAETSPSWRQPRLPAA